MVQRKAPNNLVIKASLSLKTEKTPSSTFKPSNQNHDTNSKGPELAKKMIKSRSFKRSSSDLNTLKNPSLRSFQRSDQPQKQPPNYMKATSCSEARKEKKQVPKLPSNRSCSLKKVRIFTKAPNFNSSRSIKSVSKSSTATCSSTLKDGKFPPFLDLNPGGTESQGASVVKVCHYNYCSLNGHKHNSPLKSFLSTRRKALREQRIMKSVALSPSKKMSCEDDGEMKEEVGVDLVFDNETREGVNLLFDEEKDDFFLVIYVKEEGKDKAKGVLQEKEPALIDMDFDNTSSKEEVDGGEDKMIHECEYDGGIFDWETISDQESDVELEDRLYLAGLDIGDGISSPSDQESDSTIVHPSGDEILSLLDEEDVKRDDVGIAFLKEFLEEELDELSQDEITNCYVQFSDSESSANDLYEEKEFDQFSLQDYGCSVDEKTGHEEHSSPSGENLEEIKVSDQEHENTALIDIENSGFTVQAPSPVSQETVNLNTNHEEFNTCESLKTRIRSRKQGESLEGLKLFIPREPNYLEVEPDVEAEKVELRHNEMDERKNAEEWMLDYALRKAVNQLGLDRKRKVALLVEAFEKVVPP